MTKPSSDHLDPTRRPEERASALLALMTNTEKAHQLVSAPPWHITRRDGQRPAELDSMLQSPPGFICNFGVDDPATMADIVRDLQRTIIEGSRLGVPLLVHAEALNGFLAGGHMVFPTAIGLAASWSPELIEQMADVIRQQMKRVGVRQALSPNMDIALDPRWGRTHETYGEDPYLVGQMSVAYTKGLQSRDLRDGVVATAKHFIGYGNPETGINLSAYEGGPRRTRDLFAFPFEAAIQLAGLASVMNSYADVDGTPAAVSSEVLTNLLRDTLGFDGFVSSDYSTLQQVVERQRAAHSAAEAGRFAIEAGLDTEFPTPFGFGDALVGEIEAGRLDPATLDQATHRVLTAKFRLGLFENPYPQERIDVDAVASEGTELSRELARRSVVLVQNDGLLPLAPNQQRIALVGPHADAVRYQFPTYSYPAFRDMTVFMSSGGMGNMIGVDPGMAAWNNSVFPAVPVEDFVRDRLDATSLLEEIRARTEVDYEQGTGLITAGEDDAIERALAIVEQADIAVLALGGASLWFNGDRTEGEASDTADIALPTAQRRLVDAVAATGKPFVVVLVQGRAYTLPESVLAANAILVAPYGGPFGASGVAEVLFGETEPSGKLPYTIPRHVGQLPIYHHQRSGTGQRNPLPPDVAEHYLDMPATPLFPFGHGLTYTDFAFEDLSVSSEITSDGTAHVEVTVENTGQRAGTATVQLYLRATGVGVTRPQQQLGGFTRVTLEPSERARISFDVDAAQLGYTDRFRAFSIEPGTVDVWLGLSSDHRAVTGSFRITGDRQPLAASDRSFFSRVGVTNA